MNAHELKAHVEAQMKAGKYVRATVESLKCDTPGMYRSGRVSILRVFPTAKTATVEYYYTNWKGEFEARERISLDEITL